MGVRKRIKLCVLTFFIVTVCLSYAQEENVKVFIEPIQPTISKPAGSPLVLSCIGEAEELQLFENMKWTGPEGLISTNSADDISTTVSSNHRVLLIFQKPTPEATGQYSCSATYGGTVNKVDSVNITFYHGITFDECAETQAVVVHKEGRIRCRVNANPAAQLTWLRNGVQIDNKRYVSETQGVVIPEVTEEDSGIFEVRAIISSTGDIQTKRISVEVHVPPQINNFEEKYQFIEGNRVQLICQATGFPSPKFYWTNQQQQNLSSVEGYLVNSDTGVLTIQKVVRDDTGTFKCLAINSADTDAKEAYVSVIVKPEVRDFQNATIIQGRDIVMRCRVSGDPKPRVTIRKDGMHKPFDNTEDRFIVETRTEESEEVLVLTIQSVMRSDDGLYYCNGENDGGHVERVGHLQVEFAPEMFLTTTHSKKTWKDHPVNLTCIVEAIPNATITWSFRGQPIINNEIYHVYGDVSYSNLLVKPSMEITGGTNVYGKYRCDASNQHGNNSVEIELSEAREPGRLQQYSVDHVTATTITFMLKGPQDDGGLTIQEYVVQFREEEGDKSAIQTKEWFDGAPYILESLKPRTKYLFRFAAKNDAGIGRFSDDLEKMTSSESSPEIPIFTNPSGSNISRFQDSYQVRWGVPQDNGRKIEYFELRYFEIEFEGIEHRQVGNAQKVEIRNWELSPRYNITGLKPSTNYKIELRAKNEIGYSQPASMIFKTSPGSAVEEQKIDDTGSNLTVAAMVAIIIVVVLVILGLLDATCYLRYQCGVFYCLRGAVCGRSASSEKVKDGTIEDGGKGNHSHQPKGGKLSEIDNSTEETPMILGSVGSKDTKNNDHANEDMKNKSPKGSKSSVAKDSLV